MKKFLALLLIASMAFAMVACGGSTAESNTPDGTFTKAFTAYYTDFDADTFCDYTISANLDVLKYLNDDADKQEWTNAAKENIDDIKTGIDRIKTFMGDDGYATIDKVTVLEVYQSGSGKFDSLLKKMGASDFSENAEAIAEVEATMTMHKENYEETNTDEIRLVLIDGSWYMEFN